MARPVRDAYRFDKDKKVLKISLACGVLLIDLGLYVWLLLRPNGSLAGCIGKVMLFMGVAYVARVIFAMTFWWSRPPAWEEIGGVLAVIMPGVFVTMALGSSNMAKGCASIHYTALVIYIIGSVLSSFSEYQRHVFKSDKANKGKLMTSGLWSISMHINYFGDAVLYSGWALATQAWWAWWVPVGVTIGFVFWYIPGLDQYLAVRYPSEFPAYAASTKKLVPGLY